MEQLEGKIASSMPDSLFCLLANSYFLSHHKQENVQLVPEGNSWLLKKKSYHLNFPKSARRIFRPEAYERYFNVDLDETVLDVGACIGDVTIPFAKKAKKVVAIEAEPENISYLRFNVISNGLRNVQVVGKAVWNCRKTLNLKFNSDNVGCHSIVDNNAGKTLKVQADTIDNIVSDLKIRRIDFVKMDIEGAEVVALEGAEKVLGIAGKIALETHTVLGKKTSLQVGKVLKGYGFKVCIDPITNLLDMVYGIK